MPIRRVMAFSFGKMPTTSVLRLISPLTRSNGIGGVQLGPVGRRDDYVGEDIYFDLIHQFGQFARLGTQLVGDLAPLGMGGGGGFLGKGGADEGGDDAVPHKRGLTPFIPNPLLSPQSGPSALPFPLTPIRAVYTGLMRSV